MEGGGSRPIDMGEDYGLAGLGCHCEICRRCDCKVVSQSLPLSS